MKRFYIKKISLKFYDIILLLNSYQKRLSTWNFLKNGFLFLVGHKLDIIYVYVYIYRERERSLSEQKVKSLILSVFHSSTPKFLHER